MIISTPLDLPKVVPDDWEKWWSIWNANAEVPVRMVETHNPYPAAHDGFEVYNNGKSSHPYSAKFVDLARIYPSLLEQMLDVPFEVHRIRFLRSTMAFNPHTDRTVPNWAMRIMFHCDDPNPQWYYTPLQGPDTEKHYLRLPESTNWWSYFDGAVKHGTDFNPHHRKILAMIYPTERTIFKFISEQFAKFPEHVISL